MRIIMSRVNECSNIPLDFTDCLYGAKTVNYSVKYLSKADVFVFYISIVISLHSLNHQQKFNAGIIASISNDFDKMAFYRPHPRVIFKPFRNYRWVYVFDMSKRASFADGGSE